MSAAFMLEIEVPLRRFTLSAVWETSAASLGVFGHSGAGKTTILEAVAGLRKEARGLIRVSGRTWLDSARGVFLPPESRGVGYVPQDLLLFPHRDVMGNLLAGRRRAAGPGVEARRAARLRPDRVIEVLELQELEHREVAALSGGERRRVALGRALCSGPELLLLDEPLAGLDLALRRRILPYLLRVREEFAIPTLLVSHDPTEVAILSEEVMVLAEGRAVARGRPQEVLTDPLVFPMVREEGFENIVRGRVVCLAEALARVELEPGLDLMVPGQGLSPGDEAVVGLRAEDLIVAAGRPSGLSAQNVLPGTVRAFRQAQAAGEGEGPDLATVALGRAGIPVTVALTARAARDLGLRPGMPVHLVFKAQACRLLAARGTGRSADK